MGRAKGTAAATAVVTPRRKARPRLQMSEAAIADIPELTALRREAAEHAYRRHHDGPQLDAWLEQHATEDYFRYRIGRKGYRVLVARDNDGIAGVVVMRQRGQRMDGGGLYIKNRGTGVGTQLMEQREQAARDAGCTHARVSCWRTNEPAKKFVQDRGYVRTGGGYKESTVGVRVDHYERAL